MRKKKKTIRKLYYTTREIISITGLNPHQLKTLENKGFIIPAKIQNGRRYYSYENLQKLKLVSALLEHYKLNDIVSNFDKMVLEAKMNLYKKTLLEIKIRVERLLNDYQS